MIAASVKLSAKLFDNSDLPEQVGPPMAMIQGLDIIKTPTQNCEWAF